MSTSSAKLNVTYSFEIDSPYGTLIMWNMQKRIRQHFGMLIPRTGKSRGILSSPVGKGCIMNFYLISDDAQVDHKVLDSWARSIASVLGRSFERAIACETKECNSYE